MNIALVGYGKMGRAIEEIALQRGHQIKLKIDIGNRNELNSANLSAADVAIEFSGPHSAFENVMECLQASTPVICGSTGWLERYEEVKKFCLGVDGAFLYSSNFSIGVNLFFAINKQLAGLMSQHDEYQASITETHHTQKKDAPSGTAISLAEQIMEKIPRLKSWINRPGKGSDELGIISERIDPAPGTHRVKYSSRTDDIEIIHTAHNRSGFALGAVLAAEWIVNKKGVFTMNDVLGF
jgi:4-hydroxy-tetrahydrodipicolinate reductase